MTVLDARGMECPKPVIETKKIIENMSSGELEVLVDNEIAVENVARFAKSEGCIVEVENIESDYKLSIKKGINDTTNLEGALEVGATREQVLLVASQHMGRGNDELGQVLMRSFFYTLAESENKFRAIIFINSGVFLTCEGSEILDSLKQLEALGAEILSCGTCLNFNNIQDKLAIGNVSNMYTIAEYLTDSSYKLINI